LGKRHWARAFGICDFKPVEVEVAIARLEDRGIEADSPVQILRFANRVPLQFDKASCAIFQAIQTVNWRSYGLAQPKESVPQGPYIIAVSVVSPFIKFKNASKETVDASDDLVEEIRRALIQAGQKLSKHIRREDKANELEEKLRHIEQFCPILVEGLCRITKAPDTRKKRAEEGLVKLLGRDAHTAEQDLKEAESVLVAHQEAKSKSKAAPAQVEKAVKEVKAKSKG
jgi:DNA topoisomerase-6 subunit B